MFAVAGAHTLDHNNIFALAVEHIIVQASFQFELCKDMVGFTVKEFRGPGIIGTGSNN